MTDVQAAIRLQTWLSPAFPTGAFSYSHGLEQAINDQLIDDQISLIQWLSSLLKCGAGWNDAVILAESWRQTTSDHSVVEIAELAEAMCLSKERYLETMSQGSAFLNAATAWGSVISIPDECPLPVAVGAIAGHHEINLETTLAAFLHAYISNQVQAALRLMKLGQYGGVEVLNKLEAVILTTAQLAQNSNLDDLGSSAFMADITAMKHETLNNRIFRS